MDAQGPPFRYPSLSDSTSNASDTRTRTSSTTTVQGSGSPPTSPRQHLPAYGEDDDVERSAPPPEYAESLEAEDNGKSLKKRVLLIRLLTSVFVTLLVALIVAAVVGKINEEKRLSKSPEERDVV